MGVNQLRKRRAMYYEKRKNKICTYINCNKPASVPHVLCKYHFDRYTVSRKKCQAKYKTLQVFKKNEYF